MSVTDPRTQLVRVLACIDQQVAEAESLAAELSEGSADWQCAIEWQEELSAARADTIRRLNSLG